MNVYLAHTGFTLLLIIVWHAFGNKNRFTLRHTNKASEYLMYFTVCRRWYPNLVHLALATNILAPPH
ncbi:hypothetical protein BLA29_014971, partial [Euroglyphus maynei]